MFGNPLSASSSLLVFSTLVFHVQAVTFLGCYIDSSSIIIMRGLKKEFPGSLTPKVCQDFCEANGFRYAGLQFKKECHCSNSRPHFKAFTPIGACNTNCDGDPVQMCGGVHRMSVFDLKEVSGENHIAKNYIGCYTDIVRDRTLKGYEDKRMNRLTPEACASLCYIQGFRYSGVEFHTECFCGDRFDLQRKVNDDECNLPCAGDNQIKCGGYGVISIYSNEISDLSPEGKLLGCFRDDEYNRNLENKMWLQATNSPKRCYNICLNLNHTFAGVETKDECFCGNRRPSPHLQVEISECGWSCSGGSPDDRCGGQWRQLVYEIGANDMDSPAPSHPAKPISTDSKCVTTFNERSVCENIVIFEDDFSKNQISSEKWSHMILMPTKPDHEFVVLDDKDENAYIKDGRLYIKPTTRPSSDVRYGIINLEKCTSKEGHSSVECRRQAFGPNILPPVQSSRISTKNSFSFKYGKVTVRARLPMGDWIVPEIWLEPKKEIYGPQYKSGRIKIVTARGNLNLKTKSGEDIDIKTVESGVIAGNGNDYQSKVLSKFIANRQPLSDEEVKESYGNIQLKNYTIVWTPDNIAFSIDGVEQGKLLPEESAAIDLTSAMGFGSDRNQLWSSGTRMAPFDQEFYLTLGVSVGGMRYFPDESFGPNNHQKPWKNYRVTALSTFWKDIEHWSSTWSWKPDQTALVVDSITVESI